MVDIVEHVARAICEADPTAPDPEPPILIGMKNSKAWEGRVAMAEAAIAVVKNEVGCAVLRIQSAYPDGPFPPDSLRGQAGKTAPMIIKHVIKEINAA